MVAGPEPLYLDVMTWRATKNALAGLLTGLAGGVLLGVLIVIWGAAIFSLVEGPGGWAHAALYLAGVVLVSVLIPGVVQGLSALQRARLRATLGAEIPAPVRPLERTLHQLAYHLLALFTGVAGGLLVPLFPVAPGLARWVTRTDEDGPGAARARPARGAGAAGGVAGAQPRRPGRRGRR